MIPDNPFQVISSTWLPVRVASKKYKVPESVLTEWIKQHHLTATVIGTRWLIKESSLIYYTEFEKKMNELEEYFQTLINEKHREVKEIIQKEKDPVLIPKKIGKEAFYFNFVVKELSHLIESPKSAATFQKFCVGKDTYKITQEQTVSYDKLYFHYRKGIQTLMANPLFHEQDYRVSIEKKNKEIELLENECKQYENKIVTLCIKIYGEHLQKTYPELEPEEINILVQFLNGLKLKKETLERLHRAGFSTTESLVRYMLQNGFVALYKKKLINKLHLNELKSKFDRIGILKYILLPE